MESSIIVKQDHKCIGIVLIRKKLPSVIFCEKCGADL